MSDESVHPMLGDLNLSLVQHVEVRERQVLVHHDVPGHNGKVIQRLNRDGTQVTIGGIAVGDDVRDKLKALREKFHNAEPVQFIADLNTATQIQQVLIAEFQVRELAGKPNRFSYYVELHEFVAPPPVEPSPQPEIDERGEDEAERILDEVANQRGALEVQLESRDPTDADLLSVFLEGDSDEGEPFSLLIDKHESALFRADKIPPGNYQVCAVHR